MKRLLPAAIVALLPVAFLTGYVARGNSDRAAPPTVAASDAPTEHAVEVGFARDMSVHHSQAVDMAERMRARNTDQKLRTLATDIVLTQLNQIGQFRGWLEQWNLPMSSTDAPMSWMTATSTNSTRSGDIGTDSTPTTTQLHVTGMDDMNNPNQTTAMPGMASRADLNALSSAPIADAERSFLELMIRHHQGGVLMADAVLTRTKRPEVIRIAKSIVTSQTGEIAAMRQLLAARNAGQS